MAVSTGTDGGTMSDINTTPLVDVMLVLLIIFLITVPAVVQSVKLKLPDVTYQPTQTKPENLLLSVRGANGKCEVYRGMSLIGHQALYDFAKDKMERDIERLGGPNAAINPDDIPEVHIRGDVDAPYKCIGAAIYTVQAAGFIKVGFISQPPPKDF